VCAKNSIDSCPKAHTQNTILYRAKLLHLAEGAQTALSEYGIHILVVAPQEYVNIYSTRRLLIYIYIYIYIHIYIYIYTYIIYVIYIYTYIHIYICMCVCVRVCVGVYVYLAERSQAALRRGHALEPPLELGYRNT